MRPLLALVLGSAVFAQAPVRLIFQCSAEDLDAIGQTCSDADPCPVYLELASIEAVGPKLFATGNLHTERSTIASILLASADGGRTWNEPHERIRTAGLDQIQFIDADVGWVAGQALAGRPRDPFLLLTTDGGKTWRQRLVFDEAHSGIIEQFWFDSRRDGQLLIDQGGRHELCESMTGGESWDIRQVSPSPLRLKRARQAVDPDWRLRPDAESYHVEHRAAGKWIRVAAFALRVGECKRAEPVFAEPIEADPVPEGEPSKKPAAKKKQ